MERLLPVPPRRSASSEDIDEVSERFELTGGNIRNVVFGCVLSRNWAMATDSR